MVLFFNNYLLSGFSWVTRIRDVSHEQCLFHALAFSPACMCDKSPRFYSFPCPLPSIGLPQELPNVLLWFQYMCKFFISICLRTFLLCSFIATNRQSDAIDNGDDSPRRKKADSDPMSATPISSIGHLGPNLCGQNGQAALQIITYPKWTKLTTTRPSTATPRSYWLCQWRAWVEAQYDETKKAPMMRPTNSWDSSRVTITWKE